MIAQELHRETRNTQADLRPRARSSRLALMLAGIGVAGAVLGGVAWDAARSGPVWHQLRRIAGLVETPHPAGRWYAFGYQQGKMQARVSRALEAPVVPMAADLAYALKVMGVESPPREYYELCLRGYQDGMAGKELRYVPTKPPGQDGFPESLEGL